MKQQTFELQHAATWDSLEQWLNAQGKKKKKPKPQISETAEPILEAADVPHQYRLVCHHLAVARERQYSAVLVERLNRLVLDGHQVLYGARVESQASMLAYFRVGFPVAVRQEWRLVLLGMLLLFGPMLTMVWLLDGHPHLVYSIMSPENVATMEAMYRPDAEHIGRERGAGSDMAMFGHYIRNNISIDFQCFASGLIFGIGSVFYLLFNGLYIGAVAGHLTQIGYGHTFWPFVSGHSATELTAAALSGAAGLRLGLALLRPGRRTRMRALREDARLAMRLLYGAATMTFIAAFIEAFWSSSTLLPNNVKYLFGAMQWILLLAYFTLAGRGHAAE